MSSLKNIRKIMVIATIFAIVGVNIGCAKAGKENTTVPTTAKNSEITVSAAASLKDAMEEIEKIYEKQQPQVKINFNYGSSGSLQQQIEQGAPVDIFISAANKQMDALAKKQLIEETSRKVLLKNKVVLVIPNNSHKISKFSDLTKEDVTRVALGEPASVPAGKYGKEVLTSFNLWDKVEAKAVYGKDVRQVLNWVETANVDAGLTYYTDALFSEKAKIIAIASEESHAPVDYPIAVLKESKMATSANVFVQFLLSAEAKSVFEKYGFTFVGK